MRVPALRRRWSVAPPGRGRAAPEGSGLGQAVAAARAGTVCSPRPPAAPLLRPRRCRSRRAIIGPWPCGERAAVRPPGAPRRSRAVTGPWGGGRRRRPLLPLPVLYLPCGAAQPLRHRPGAAGCRGTRGWRGGGRTPRGAQRCRGTRLRLHGRRRAEPAPGGAAVALSAGRAGWRGRPGLVQLPYRAPPTSPVPSGTAVNAGGANSRCPPSEIVRSICLVKGDNCFPSLSRL